MDRLLCPQNVIASLRHVGGTASHGPSPPSGTASADSMSASVASMKWTPSFGVAALCRAASCGMSGQNGRHFDSGAYTGNRSQSSS